MSMTQVEVCPIAPVRHTANSGADVSYLTSAAYATSKKPACGKMVPPPGVVWSDRFGLSKEMQDLLNRNPVLRMTSTTDVCLDVRHIQDKADTPTRKLLDKFRESLKSSFDVSECMSPLTNRNKSGEGSSSPLFLETGAHGIKKRKSRTEDTTEDNLADESKSLFSNFKVVTKRPKSCSEIAPSGICGVVATNPISYTNVHNAGPRNNAYKTVARNVDCMQVPVGISPLDRVTLYDSKNKALTRMYIDMPRNAYDGMRLLNIQPESHFKQLMVDGDGFKAGGTAQQQHACRLYVHRQLCTNGSCTVLGCGFDPAYKIFKDAAPNDLKCSYEKHWKTQRKMALRMHGHSLKVKAGSMS